MMPGSDKRLQERTEVNWIAIARSADGTEAPCTIKDVSATGMKLALSAEVVIPETFYIKVVGKDLVFHVKQAWRRGHFLGLIILKMAKLPKSQHGDDRGPDAPGSASGHTRLGVRMNYRTRG